MSKFEGFFVEMPLIVPEIPRMVLGMYFNNFAPVIDNRHIILTPRPEELLAEVNALCNEIEEMLEGRALVESLWRDVGGEG